MQQWQTTLFQVTLFALSLSLALLIGADSAWAKTASCTSHSGMQATTAAGHGIVSAVMQTVIGLLNNTSEALYDAVIDDASPFIQIRNAAILLAVMFYGVMIIFNLANFKPGEILGILFKIGLVMALTSDKGWEFFNSFIGDFFFGTMIEMIEIFMGQTAIASAGGYTGQGTPQAQMADRIVAPLSMFNWPMARIISTQFFITVVGSLAIPTYGLVLGLLLLWGGFNLLMTLVGALFTYIKCIVGLWFLFALAPIFFVLLLFGRTRNLFEGWINMVLSFTLQPILLFAFLAFFITITTTSLGELMQVNWCWAVNEGAADGTSAEFWFWRPVNIIVKGVPKEIEGGIWGVLGHVLPGTGKVDPDLPAFPIDPTDIMFFLLSSYVAWQYSRFVPLIASELAQSGLRLSVNAEAARNYFSSRGWTPMQVGTKAIGGARTWF